MQGMLLCILNPRLYRQMNFEIFSQNFLFFLCFLNRADLWLQFDTSPFCLSNSTHGQMEKRRELLNGPSFDSDWAKLKSFLRIALRVWYPCTKAKILSFVRSAANFWERRQKIGFVTFSYQRKITALEITALCYLLSSIHTGIDGQLRRTAVPQRFLSCVWQCCVEKSPKRSGH